MKGYYSENGFYGFVDGDYRLFASQSDYYEEMETSIRRIAEFDQYKTLVNDLWD